MKDLIIIIINNVKGSLLTTILGIILFAAGLVAFFWNALEIEKIYSIELMALGLVVACLKDPGNKPKQKGREKVALGMIAFAIMFSGCATERRCSNKFGTSTSSDSVQIEYIETVTDSLVYIPGDSVTVFIKNPCDSLGFLKPNIYHLRGDKNKVNSTVVISREGIEVECVCAEEYLMIRKLTKEIKHLENRSHKSTVVYKNEESIWSKFWTGVILFLVGYLSGLFKIHKIFLKLKK